MTSEKVEAPPQIQRFNYDWFRAWHVLANKIKGNVRRRKASIPE